VFTSICCVIAALSAATARETYRTDMHDLGHVPSAPQELREAVNSSSTH